MTSFLDSELSDSEVGAFEAHLADCPACRNELQSLAYSFRLVTSRLGDELDPPRWNRVEEQIQGRAPGRFDLRWLRGFAWRPAAALIAVGAVLVVPWYWSASRERAEMSERFEAFIEEREQLEEFHREVNNLEPVGWVYYNPYSVDARHDRNNPYARR